MAKILQNIARSCRCRQSSIDPNMQKNPDGASAAVNTARTGHASFFTQAEQSPWWEIDLGQSCTVDSIVIYNWDRQDALYPEAGRSRCRFLQIWGSNNGIDWKLLHDRRTGQKEVKDFGGIVHGPLYVELKKEQLQFLRLTISSGGILHLNAVQVFADREVDLSLDIDAALLDVFLYANELNLKIANRIFSALDISASELMTHAERLGVTLQRSGGWFVFNQLQEGGRIKEAQQFLEQQADLLGLATKTLTATGSSQLVGLSSTFSFDRVDRLAMEDPHYWIGALPEYVAGSYSWIDQAYRFTSRKHVEEVDRRAPILYDDAPETTRRIYFCGGCEFSYAGFFLRLRGYEISNTFLDHRSSDPVAQFLGGSGEQLVQFKPDLIILSMQQPFKQLLLKTFTLSDYSRQEQLADLRGLIASFERAIAVVRKLSPHSKLSLLSHISYSNRVMHFYEEATFGHMQGDPYTIHDLAKAYDLELSLLARKQGALLLDFEEIISKFGKSSVDGMQNHARAEDYLGGHPELAGARMIANTIDGWVATLYNERPKIKLMVLDLDNTMWDGVFREDGIEHVTRGIRVGHCYVAMYLAEQGMLLALCSKNNPETAQQLRDVLESMFPGLGRKIVAMRVNWLPKSENIKSIVSELNIGMDSVAFFDDQAFERAEVASALPLVRIFTDADLLQVARYAPFLPSSPVSAEGRERADSYITEQTRREEESKYSEADYGDFLVSCQFQLTARLARRVDVLRVAELFHRTNQQNITLRRTSKEFIDGVIESTEWHVWCCELSDRFGDYGMIGAILVEFNANPQIVELAFSCRAMGKGLEKAFLQKVAHYYQLQGLAQLLLPIQKNDKNQGMIDIVKSAGFVDVEDDQLRLDLQELPSSPIYDRWINWQSEMATVDSEIQNAECVLEPVQLVTAASSETLTQTA